MPEINKENEKGINADINLLLMNENIFKIPDVYKLDYRWKSDEESKKMMKDFIEKYSEKNEKKDEKFDDSDVFWFEKAVFEKSDKWGKTEYKEVKKSKSVNNNKIINEDLYSFKVNELVELEKYLKSKIFGQNEIIDQIIDNMLMHTYRTKNNETNAWVYLQFWPSWSWKNYIWELVAEKLWFELENIDISAMHFVEAWSLLWVTSWYGNWEDSILENIYNRSVTKNWNVILIIDEFDKGQITENWNCATFLSSIMSLLSNKKVRTKDTNAEIILSNFIFVFNSNYWFDNFIINEKVVKIWFDVDENNKQSDENNSPKQITTTDIEKYFKKELKVQVSVFNRLKKANNIIIFNQINNQILENYKNEKYEELKEEIAYYLWLRKEKMPKINYFNNKFENFDISWWFRLLNNIIFQEIKLYLIKRYGVKNQFKKWKLVWMRK